MCFQAVERCVWSPLWIHCWCWTAPGGFLPRCSARPWGGGRCSRRPGWSCPFRRTRTESTSHSLARCSDQRTASFSAEVWNQLLPGPSIHESAWRQVTDDHAMIKTPVCYLSYLFKFKVNKNSRLCCWLVSFKYNQFWPHPGLGRGKYSSPHIPQIVSHLQKKIMQCSFKTRFCDMTQAAKTWIYE